MASAFDVVVTAVMATEGWLMSPVSWSWVGGLIGASVLFLATGNAFRLAASAALRSLGPAHTHATTVSAGSRPAGT